MSAANDPTPPAGAVQATPPQPPAAGIKLPPPKPAPTAHPVSEWRAYATARLDAGLVAAVLGLAFLLASFAVKNSDFWLHLATGRLVAEGKYAFGVDPFAYTTEGVYWANHAWLFDTLLYFGYQALGGTALVVLKALLVVALAAVLLGIRRPGQSLWIPAALTGLALVALSWRLLLQPTLVSFLLLAVTAWLLHRWRQGDSPRVLWWLVPLFALWVNLDSWFFLGPLTVGLVLLGELLQARFGPAAGATAPEGRRALALAFAGGLVACLLSPHHVHAFTLPPELWIFDPVPLLQEKGPPDVQRYFYSPFQPGYFDRGVPGRTVAGFAFFPLALAGLASFWVNRKNVRWGRVLVFAVFLLLAAVRWRAVPFFAVVAGPIAVLNFQDWCAARGLAAPTQWRLLSQPKTWTALAGIAIFLAVVVVAIKVCVQYPLVTEGLGIPDPPVPFLIFGGFVLGLSAFVDLRLMPYAHDTVTTWALGGRLLTVKAALLLLLAAWPGWLHSWRVDLYQAQARRAAWAVESDPSFKRAAEALGRLRQDGILPANAHGFHVLPDAANYCAWYCPEEKVFFDSRFPLFAAAADDYLELRATFTPKDRARKDREPDAVNPVLPEESPEQREAKLLERLHKHRIDHVVVSDSDPRWALVVGKALSSSDKGEWTLLYLDGRSGILAWNDPANGPTPERVRRLNFEPDQRAFGPVPEEDRAPEQGRPMPAGMSDLARFVLPPPAPQLRTEEAVMHAYYFDGMSPGYLDRNRFRYVQAYKLGVLGAAASPQAGHVGGPSLLASRLLQASFLFPEAYTGPLATRRSQRLDQVAFYLMAGHLGGQDEGPPGAAFLAIRAARRAIADNPADPYACLALEQGYSKLRAHTQEREWVRDLPTLGFLRHVQMVAALQRALALQPDLARAHHELADLLGKAGYLDLALKHHSEDLRLSRAAGPEPGEKPDDFRQRLDDLDDAVKKMQKEVSNRQNQYTVRSSGQRTLQKAQLAREMFLGEQAVTVLLESDYVDFGIQGARLQIELLLSMGRLDDVRRMLKAPEVAEKKETLEFATIGESEALPAYDWYTFLLAMAEGNYQEADERLEEMTKAFEPLPPALRFLSEVMLAANPHKPWAGYVAERQLSELRRQEGYFRCLAMQRQRMNLEALRGLVGLEVGDTERARGHFRQALNQSIPPDRYVPGLAGLGAASPLEEAVLYQVGSQAVIGPLLDFNGRQLAVRYLQLIEDARR